MNNDSFGLVLSGGGAKGAYEAGVVKALAERGVRIQALAGASIGALNGAMVAASPDLTTAARRLAEVWRELANSSPLRAKAAPHYMMLLSSAGLKLYGGVMLGRLASAATSIAGANLVAAKMLSRLEFFREGDGLLSSDPLHEMLDRYLDMDALQCGISLHVSVYPYPGLPETVAEIGLAVLGVRDNRLSEFKHVQSMPSEQQRSVLLASAALPMIFEPQKIGEATYTDGGQGGWRKAQGNTPIQPLLDAGIQRIIVTHLEDGALWSRHDFSKATIIEIRPRKPIARGALDLVAFNAESIVSWMEQGYEDTLACWDQVEAPLHAIENLSKSFDEIDAARSEGIQGEEGLDAAISRLRNRRRIKTMPA